MNKIVVTESPTDAEILCPHCMSNNVQIINEHTGECLDCEEEWEDY